MSNKRLVYWETGYPHEGGAKVRDIFYRDNRNRAISTPMEQYVFYLAMERIRFVGLVFCGIGANIHFYLDKARRALVYSQKIQR